jgi:toxin ParE1/3/4
MHLVFAEPAARDLEDIIDTIATHNPTAAEGVYRSVMGTARNLADFPDIGRVGRLPGTREFPLPGLPYLLGYQVISDTVTILAVFHGARDLARALKERRTDTQSS